MIKITVPAMPSRHVAGTSSKSGKPVDYAFDTQTIYYHVQDQVGQPLPFPEKSEIILDKGQVAFPPGEYTLSPNSLYVDKNGRLAVAPKLVPLKPRG